ncbi:MAG: glycogen-binding domain-containing protein [Desulfovibrio sp.]
MSNQPLEEYIINGIHTVDDDLDVPDFRQSVLKEIQEEAYARPQSVANSATMKERFFQWLFKPASITVRPVYALSLCCLVLSFFAGTYFSGEEPAPIQRENTQRVTFVLPATAGKYSKVSVIGTFNDWQNGQVQMQYDSQLGLWVADVELNQGSYEYVYLIDDETTVPDPEVRLVKDDGFGNMNSVIFVDGGYGHEL